MKIAKRGNSLMVTLSPDHLNNAGFKKGDDLEVSSIQGKIVLTKKVEV